MLLTKNKKIPLETVFCDITSNDTNSFWNGVCDSVSNVTTLKSLKQ